MSAATLRRGASRPAHRRGAARRKGVASLLAMLYMLIFSALAIGFYTAVTMAAQVAHNDERVMNAQFATESGLRFVQYQLSRVRIPPTMADDEVFGEVFRDLVAQQGTSANLAGKTITHTGGTIHFPAPGEFIELDGPGARFRADISDTSEGWLKVRVQGRYGNASISRTVAISFERVVVSTNIFDYAIVSNGVVSMQGNAKVLSGSSKAIDASVLSTSDASTSFTLTGSVEVQGDLYMVNPDGNVASSGKVSIGESQVPQIQQDHIHRDAPGPEFPTVDTSIFRRFLTSTYQPGRSVYRNCLVPAGTNPNFTRDVTIEGVLYIEYPNRVSFAGSCTVKGIIVVANGARPGADNTLSFQGSFSQKGLETLPPSKEFPPDLLALTGSSLLAPGFAVSFGGNAGTVGGTMVADSFKFFGNAGGDIAGTVIALGGGPLEILGDAKIRRSRPTVEIPAGLLFSRTYKPRQETYREVPPGQSLDYTAVTGRWPEPQGKSRRGWGSLKRYIILL